MLILLPPSEGKTAPRRGKPLDLTHLSFAGLSEARGTVLDALIQFCTADPDGAAKALGLGPSQTEYVGANTLLRTAPTARAERIYTGVLYDALDLGTLEGAAKSRATRWLATMSSAFGAVRPSDPIPAYRLSGDTKLPGIGTVSSFWRDHLDAALTPAAGSGLVIDLRSGQYAGFWHPTTPAKVAKVRVLHEHNGQRKVVSHFNKATKGRIVRALLLDGGTPKTPAALADHVTDLGWTVELGAPGRSGQQLDVIVREL